MAFAHRRTVTLVVTGLIALFTSPVANADNVFAGYDLFTSVSPGTTFGGVQFQGVPIGNFNFGGTIGVQPVGVTDTIVHRLTSTGNQPPGGSATVSLAMLDLQLMSTVPANFGLGVGIYFITLQSMRSAAEGGPGPATTGQITINFANPTPPPTAVDGTFSSFFDVFFDVRLGSLTGPIAQSGDLVLTNGGASWSHTPLPGAILINGVNSNLNGQDHTNDFFIIPPLVETHPTGATHTVTEAGVPVPEPSALALMAAGAFAMLSAWKLRRRRAGQAA
jgi:hypothetical protein